MKSGLDMNNFRTVLEKKKIPQNALLPFTSNINIIENRKVFYNSYLPNNVIFNILLHCIAKFRSELSNIVIKSLSETDKHYTYIDYIEDTQDFFSINPYHVEFLKWNNPSPIFGTIYYHFRNIKTKA